MEINNIRGGQRWFEEIQRALDDAKCFLIVIGSRIVLESGRIENGRALSSVLGPIPTGALFQYWR